MVDEVLASTASILEPQRRSSLPSTFQQLHVHTDWRMTWTHIVGGKFSSSHDDGVLFYESGTGFAEIYDTDGHGNISLLRQHPDLGRIGSRSRRWTQIVAGRFSDSVNNSLLLVDRRSGFAAMFNVSSTGDLIKLREYPNFGRWTHVTAVRLVRDKQFTSRSGVLRYDRATGRGEILECDASGNLTLRQQSDGWRKTWSHVVGGFASGNSVLFYDESTGHCEIYQLNYDPTAYGADVNSLGGMAAIELPPGASIIVGGSFGLDSGYAVYFPQLGRLQFLFMVGGINDQEFYDGLGGQWDLIAPGGFWTPDEEDHKFRDGRFSSLMLYDRNAGRGEFHLHWPFDSYVHAPLAGYTSRGSVRPGEPIDFFVSSCGVGPFTMHIYRLGTQRQLMAEVLNHAGGAQPLPIRRLAYRDGPDWDPVATVQIPAHWPSGLYVAHVTAGGIPDVGGATANEAVTRLDIPFVVRTREPGSQSGILVFVNDTTYEAYNFWGRSLYGFRSFNSSWYTSPGAGSEVMPMGFRLSFRRPFIGETPFVGQKWTYWEEPLAKWLGRLGIDVEWATLVDLHQDPNLLDAYDMVVSTGHAEYFSREIYDRLQAFTARGGNAAFFSGNNCWWRIRIEDGGDTLVCYKKEEFDPAPEKTINWTAAQSGALMGTHEVTVLGADPPDDLSRSRDDINGVPAHFVVREPAHWVFAGTNLQEDDWVGTFGNHGTVVGYETDRTTGEQEGWTTLADVHFAAKEAEASNPPEIATMMISEQAGAVFTASTIDWTRGLSQDANTWTAVDQITLNLFVRFGGLGAACDIVGFDSNGAVQVDFTNIGFRSTWDVMLAGAFTRSDRDQIVLYDRAGGALAVVGFDNTGRANLDRTDDTIGSNWTTLVAGNFVGDRRKQVLMYDKATGDTLLVGFDAAGQINLRRADSGWRESWDLITVGPFIGNGRDQVLLYDRAGRTADVVGFDTAGHVNLDTSNTGWRPSWDWMAPGHFFGNQTSEVWLCDRSGDSAEIVAFDAAGNFRSMQTMQFNSLGGAAGRLLDTRPGGQSNQQQILRWPNYAGDTALVQGVADDLNVVAGDWMRKPWNWLVVGRFKGTSLSEYVRYTAADGTAELYGLDASGNISRRQDFSGWRSSWALAVSGRFLGNGRDQLALYDRGQF
jgi:hypothetical protein